MKNTNSKLKSLAIVTIALFVFLANGCSNNDKVDDPNPNPDPVPNPYAFPGPTYIDNYSAIASWDSNSSWNLANVHDPTVEKCGEYYYMYQTDASYGNVTNGHGHFFYRRSKNLVTWEFMGASMNTAPAWVKDSLNNKRSRMNPA